MKCASTKLLPALIHATATLPNCSSDTPSLAENSHFKTPRKIKRLMLGWLTLAVWMGLIATALSTFGQNWIQTSAPTNNWTSVACSADGSKIVAVAGGGGIYTSADSGSSWNMTAALSNYWTGVACSLDGNKIVAVSGGGGIWISAGS